MPSVIFDTVLYTAEVIHTLQSRDGLEQSKREIDWHCRAAD